MAADPAGPTRRRVLGASALTALAVAGVAGCAAGQPWPWAAPPRSAPDVGVLRDVIAAEATMIARYTSVLAAFPALSRTAAPLLAEHRSHLAQLRAWLVIPRGAGPSASAAARVPVRRPPPVPASPAAAVAYLRAAERGQAAALVRWLVAVPPSLAQLLASIGASEATHAAALAPGSGPG